MSQHFTHLHLHTDFSLLDGAISLDALIDFGKKNQFKALAITDHGNIFGAVKFFQQCKKAGIKPILGIEAYITDDAAVKSADNKYYHIVLLVQNATGYKNLCKLISYSFQKGFYFKPRIDYAILKQHAEGLIATSACLGGHIPKMLMEGNEQEAERLMDWFLDVFGKERFYLEMQPADLEEQKKLNALLRLWSEKKGIELVVTADCHYPTPEDREAHEVMLCIQTQGKMSDADRYTFGDCRVHMRTTEEMLTIFADTPQAVWNTGKIADMCNFSFETGKLFFPLFTIPEGYTEQTFFVHLCNQGLQKLFDQGYIAQEHRTSYQERLDLEVKLIINMGFIGYFLIVSDFIQWARRNGIPVGPGRGSAAGSLVAWSLEITYIDPIKYNLLFERFLNPERVSMPDIDIDFCIEGRETVIQYIRDKYGHDKVCQIITFGTMAAKGALKDVARALGFPFDESNMITSLVPDELKITLHDALEQEPRLRELITNNDRAKKLFDIAFKVEGKTRHASKHAAGIVISPEPIDEILPIYIPSKSTELVTQYAMTELESLGFLKIDLLGLKNLTLIDRVLKLVQQSYGITLDINMLPLDDQKTFALICAGKTSGVFQLESDGLKDVLRKLQPDKFEDIIAVNALYRPGPLGSGMVTDFIERRHGRQKITYLFPELQPVLEETYGVIVYQEQVMKIASVIAGYSLGESDILRRAMGKKKAEVMAEQRTLFLDRALKNNFNGKKAGELFDLMVYFAGYGFNKSHSAAYALIAYQTAYLKANYMSEFMACLISLEADHAEKMSFYLHESKDLGLPLIPPSINHSEIEFTVQNNAIVFGLRGIKNVGLAALENIIAARLKGPFSDLLDFCNRVDLRTANKRVLEHLIWAGAFDAFSGSRAQKTNDLEAIMDLAAERKKEILTGQMGLFGPAMQTQENGTNGTSYTYQPCQEWTNTQILEKEKEVVGFYLSAHPLEAYDHHVRWFAIPSFEDSLQRSKSANSEHEITVLGLGLVKEKREIVTKKGDRMAFVQLEDKTSHAEIIVFPKLFKNVEQWLQQHSIFVVKGEIDALSDQKCKIKASLLVPLDIFFQEWKNIEGATMTFGQPPDQAQLQRIKELLVKGSIPLRCIVQENDTRFLINTRERIALDTDLMKALEQHGVGLSLSL